MPPKRVNHIELFSKFLEELGKNIIRDKEHEYYFRGHTENIQEILPKIYRKIEERKIVDNPTFGKDEVAGKSEVIHERALIKNEDKIFKETILRAPQDFTSENTTIEKLVKMQHYGLPTRLLDITSNPLVALYFACENSAKQNGELVIFKIPKDEIKFYDSDTVTILANISKMKNDFTPDGHTYLVHEIRNDKPQFSDDINEADYKKVLAVKVKLNNNRIVRQNGAFLLYGINETKNIPAQINPEWIEKVIPIKQNEKAGLLKALKLLGINHSNLYPEIESQAEGIIEMYEYRNLKKIRKINTK